VKKLGTTRKSVYDSKTGLVEKLATRIFALKERSVLKNKHLLTDIADITFEGERAIIKLKECVLNEAFNDGLIIAFIVRGKFNKKLNRIGLKCKELREALAKTFDGVSSVKPKGNHSFKYSL